MDGENERDSIAFSNDRSHKGSEGRRWITALIDIGIVITFELAIILLASINIIKFSLILLFSGFLAFPAIALAILLLTLPSRTSTLRRKKFVSVLRVGLIILSLELFSIYVVYILVPAWFIDGNFLVFLIPQAIGLIAFSIIVSSYGFNHRFVKISRISSLRLTSDSNGMVQGIQRDNILDQRSSNLIEAKIRGDISDEDFRKQLDDMDPVKRKLIETAVQKVDEKLKGMYKW